MPFFEVRPGDTITLEYTDERVVEISEGFSRVTHRRAPQPIRHEELFARGAYLGPDGRARYLTGTMAGLEDEVYPYHTNGASPLPPPRLRINQRPAARPKPLPILDPEDPFSMDA